MNPFDLYVKTLVVAVVLFLLAGYFVPAYYAFKDLRSEEEFPKRKAALWGLGWPVVLLAIVIYEIYNHTRKKRTAS